ncbi:proteasome maturation protein-like isoform X1 [Daphnia carinata]|uniref:proteasome maturation protein-like isoform X1 n=1 Tax=Daphnia carinata TaxID=120202 RepID=UPI00257B0D1D|nr:proteasome maturation protein-like isoform X1 [Daphnia carinata]
MEIQEKSINKDKCSIGVEANYDVKDAMLFGVKKNRTLDSFTPCHPLEVALLKHSQKEEEINMRMLRTMQGMHAPIRLHMEKLAVKDIGHLPCLHRHNALLDALTGKDTTIEFEDFLNVQTDSEIMGQPHMMIERQLGIL